MSTKEYHTIQKFNCFKFKDSSMLPLDNAAKTTFSKNKSVTNKKLDTSNHRHTQQYEIRKTQIVTGKNTISPYLSNHVCHRMQEAVQIRVTTLSIVTPNMNQMR